MRRWRILLTAWLLCLASAAHAEWPERPIHIIVPYPPGGGTDLTARVIGSYLEKSLGQPIIIDNRPGGSTVTGTAALARAEPDGYTLGMVFDSLAINAAMGVPTPYDPEKDFTPIIYLADVPLVFIVNAKDVQQKTMPELVSYANAHPGWFTFGSLGPGSPHEIGFLWFKAMAKMDALVVPYRGVAPALEDVVADHVKGMFLGVAIADSYIQQGILRTLGVSSAKRLASAPDIPTIAEQGYPEFNYVTFYGLAAPKGTPSPIIERVNAEINKVLALPEVKERLGSTGAILGGGSSKEFAEYLTANMAKFRKIMALTGAKGQ
jgi:tripartite-type tricarboxylate transporter receptor subunit TctC